MTQKRSRARILALLLSLLLCFGLIPAAYAAEDEGGEADGQAQFVTLSVEKFTIGQGYYLEPVRVEITPDESCASVVSRIIGLDNLIYGGSVDSGFYISGIKNADDGTLNIPQYILDGAGLSVEEDIDENEDSNLDGGDFYPMSGWMYTVNNVVPSDYMDAYKLKDGDVIRLQFSLYGWGGDIGVDWGYKIADMADKDEITRVYAELKANPELEKLGGIVIKDESLTELFGEMTAAQWLSYLPELIAQPADGGLATDESLALIAQALSTAEENYNASRQALSVLDESLEYMYQTVSQPYYKNSEWTMLALARAGYELPDSYFLGYAARLRSHLDENGGALGGSKTTEYSRVILALSAFGNSAGDFRGYDLTAPLENYDKTTAQGLNGAIYALIALDAQGSESAVKEEYKQHILSTQLESGGFALPGSDSSDVDMTAMAIQALAPYYNQSEQVKTAIDAAVEWLSGVQLDDGSFLNQDEVSKANAESCAQVIIALCSAGINPASDSRFVKNSVSAVDALLSFYGGDGAFRHTADSENGSYMATEQAALALTAYKRFIYNQNTVFDMTDAVKVAASAGDVNADGSIDSTDATLILQSYGGILSESVYFDETLADVAENSVIGSSDATVVLQIYGGLYAA